MTQLKMPGESPVVDFDYFDLGSGFNQKKAEQLSAVLIANASIDDIHGFMDEDGVYFNSTVGTGGSGMPYRCNSRGAQRACLASHLAAYAHGHYQSCYFALAEYECVNELLEDLEYPPSHREKLNNEHRALIEQVCRQFEIAYTKQVPGFLFTLLKNQK
jgi:hypothetical protein